MSTPTMTASTIRRLSAYLTTAVLLTTVGLIGTAHAASTPTLSINGPFEAPVGQELQVYGSLRFGGVGQEGLTVEVSRQPLGAAPVVVATVTTGAAGAYSVFDTPPNIGPTVYTARFGGSTTLDPAASSRTVDVKYPSTLAATAPTTAVVGTPIVITGSLTFADGADPSNRSIGVDRYDVTSGTALPSVTTGPGGAFTVVDNTAPLGFATYSFEYLGDVTHVATYGPQPSVYVYSGVDVRFDVTEAPSPVDVDSPFQIAGFLRADDGTPAADVTFDVWRTLPGDSEVWAGFHGTDSLGGWEFIDSIPTPGTTTYRLEFSGDNGNYSPAEATISIDSEGRASTRLSVNVPDPAYPGEPIRIWGQLTGDGGPSDPIADAVIRFELRNASTGGLDTYLPTTNANGVWEVNLSFPEVEIFAVDAFFDGDTTYAPTSNYGTLYLLTRPTLLVVDPIGTSTVGDEIIVSGGVYDLLSETPLVGEVVGITRGGSGIATYLGDAIIGATGSFEFTDSPPGAGAFNYTVLFRGTQLHAGAVTTVTADVERVATTLQVSGPASATTGDTVSIRGQLDIATGGLADQSVTVVALAGPTQYNVGTATTDSSGGFTIDDIPATNGTITYRATFAGSSDYEPSQGSADVTVTLQQQPSSLTISATEQSGRKNRGQYDLAASFTDGGPARPIAVYAQPASGGETLLATGTSVTLVVNPSETTTYVARFVGDAAYLPSEAATTVTVSTKGGGKPPKN